MAKSKASPQNLSQNQPQVVSRLEELNNLSDSELAERYLSTFQTEPAEGMERDAMVAAIDGAAPKAPAPQLPVDDVIEEGGKVYGNKDKAKKFPIKKDWKSKVVVRQVNVQTLNGGMVEVPNTEVVQTYDQDYYQKLVDMNFFSDSKMKVEVLHQPSK